MTEKTMQLIESWLASRLDAGAVSWIKDRQQAIRDGDRKALYIAFGLAPRKVGKADLRLTAAEIAAAAQVRQGWDPSRWSIDQSVRTIFVLAMPSDSIESYVETLDQLFSVGEVGELVALYQALPLLPHPTAHVLRAAEGIRTNIKAVFCAVAHHNPFPAEQFSEDQWNQMVLKCQFIGVPMSPIVGLDQRSNAHLAAMVVDFIHERWAARRPVTPEMWRCVGRHADSRALADLKQVLLTGDDQQKSAAALALSECSDPDARKLLASQPDLAKRVSDKSLTWAMISESPSDQTASVFESALNGRSTLKEAPE